MVGTMLSWGPIVFVCWRRRPAAKPSRPRSFNKGDDYYYAVVVRSECVDGKPRQKVVKHLAGYYPSELTPQWQDNEKYAEEGRQLVVSSRARFWDDVGCALDALAETL